MHAMIKSLIICCLLKDYCLPIFVSHYQIILFTDLCFFENVRVNFRFASLRHSVTNKKNKKFVNLRFASPTFASPNLASLTFASPTFALPNEQSPIFRPRYLIISVNRLLGHIYLINFTLYNNIYKLEVLFNLMMYILLL